LFFSGHIVEDDSGQLYFATSVTCKSPRTDLIRVSSIPVSFVHNLMNNGICQHQIMIIDCCFNSISAQVITRNEPSIVDIKNQLGGKGRAVLSSFIYSDNFLSLESADSSVYTRYLVEGISTGAADLDGDGLIAVDELHEYALKKVKIAAPALKPEFYAIDSSDKIRLAKAQIDNPKLKYRQQVEDWANRGEVSQAGRYILDNLAQSLALTSEECNPIEAEVLRPYQEYQEKLQRYKREFAKALSNKTPLEDQEREELKIVQQSLGLRDEDVRPIEEKLALKLVNISKVEEEEAEKEKVEENKVEEEELKENKVEENADDSEDSESQEELKSVSSKPNLIFSKYTPLPSIVESIEPTTAVNLSSIFADSPTSSPSNSQFSNKLLLVIGITGALTIAAVAVGISTRTPEAHSPIPITTATIANSSNTPNPKPSVSPSPESKSCTIFVNGNLHSEPTFFWDNVVESLRESLPVTGKQTKGGWIQVKMPNNKLAWVYTDIISNKDKKEMDACLARNGITIKTVEDIPRPASVSFPKI
jgi:hypothetical protein